MVTYDQLRSDAEVTRSKLRGYQVLDLEAIWESDIVPLIDDCEDLQDAHTACMLEFVQGYANRDQREKALTYNEPEHGGAWRFTKSDYWFTEVQNRIESAAKDGDVLAQHYQHLMAAATINHDTRLLPEELQGEIMEASWKIESKFQPKRHEPRYWVPVHACHWSNIWAYYVAKAWRPEGRWKVRTTIDHTTVVDTKAKQVFDMLMYDFPLEQIIQTGKF